MSQTKCATATYFTIFGLSGPNKYTSSTNILKKEKASGQFAVIYHKMQINRFKWGIRLKLVHAFVWLIGHLYQIKTNMLIIINTHLSSRSSTKMVNTKLPRLVWWTVNKIISCRHTLCTPSGEDCILRQTTQTIVLFYLFLQRLCYWPAFKKCQMAHKY